MKVVIQFTAQQEAKALPMLLLHAPAMILKDRIYIVSESAVEKLRDAGIKFNEISREADAPTLRGAVSGERV